MSRKFERSYPYILPLLLVAVARYYGIQFPKTTEILGSSITMGAIFIGFLATAKSILLGLQTPGFEQIRKTEFFPLLIKYLKEAIYSSLLYCCLCLAGYFVEHQTSVTLAAWIYLTGVTILTFVRVVHVFMVLVALPTSR